MKIFITNNSSETQKLGEEFARFHPFGLSSQGRRLARLIALYGDLGSGKTTFVQGLARGLGIEKRIISPTFIIVRSYILKNQKSKIKNQKYNSKFKSLGQRSFYHIDLYRIQGEKDLKGLGIVEILKDPQNIVAIEWAEKMENLLPKKKFDVKFEYLDENKRRITIAN